MALSLMALSLPIRVRRQAPRRGTRACRRVALACLMTVLAGAVMLPGSARAEGVALIIGNTGYQALPAVRTAGTDARAVATALTTAGFIVDLRLEATTRELFAGLAAFSDRASTADVALIGYFGLGAQHDGVSYLLGVDADPSAQSEWWTGAVPLHDMMQAVSGAPILGLVLVDGAWPTGLPDAAPGLAAPRTLPPGVLLAFSVAPDQALPTNVMFQAPFAAALVPTLADLDRPMVALLREVQSAVTLATQRDQTPQVFGDAERLATVLADYVPENRDAVPDAQPTESEPPPPTAGQDVVPATVPEEVQGDGGAAVAGPDTPDAVATADPDQPVGADAAPAGSEPTDGPPDAGAAAVAPADPLPSGTAPLAITRAEARGVQTALATLGYDPGVADGALGPRSRAAIAAWQSDLGAEPTGFLSATQRAALIEAADLAE